MFSSKSSGKETMLSNILMKLKYIFISFSFVINCLNENPNLKIEDLILTSLTSSPEITNPKSWKKKVKININNLGQSSNLIDFTVLVRLNPSRINYSNTLENGQDIRFFDSTETIELPFEIESWNPNGDSIFWVKIPTIPANSNSGTFWLYLSNPDAEIVDLKTQAWDSDFRTVLHFNTLADSTISNIDATICSGLDDSSGPESGPTTSSGHIGNSQEFNGNNQCLTIPSTVLPNAGTQGTIEVWVQPFSSNANNNLSRYVFSHTSLNYLTTNNRIYMSIYNCTSTCGTGNLNYYNGLGDRFAQVPPNGGDSGFDFTLNQWSHLILTWNNGNFRSYFNGNEYMNTYSTAGFIANGIEPIFRIGSFITNPDPNQYWHGKIDEMRFSNIGRSADWLRAQYLSTSDSFLQYESEIDNL